MTCAKALPALCLVLLLAAGCEGLKAPPKQQGEPCTRTDQCAAGLACCAGECMPCPDAAVIPVMDAATDAPTGG